MDLILAFTDLILLKKFQNQLINLPKTSLYTSDVTHRCQSKYPSQAESLWRFIMISSSSSPNNQMLEAVYNQHIHRGIMNNFIAIYNPYLTIIFFAVNDLPL